MSQIMPISPPRMLSVGNNAPSRVLFIPEIIYHITSYLKRSDNTRNAQVCTLWSDIALKSVWREVDDMYAVFSVLEALVEVPNTSGIQLYAFSNQPGITNWRRFNKYAAYIRKFVYAPRVVTQKLLSHEVMVQISHTRMRLDIFPNLNTLVWLPHSSAASSSKGSPTLNDGLLFMHATVTNLTFSHLNVISEPYANHLLPDLAPRMPHLTQLSFHTSEPVARIESGLSNLAKDLNAVTVIRLPAYYLTTRITEALAVLPNLRVISVGHGKPEDTYPSHPNLGLRPVLPASSFKSLKNVGLNMHAADATKVISTIPFPVGLHLLHVVLVAVDLSVDIRRLLEACSQKHKNIVRLQLLPDRSAIRRTLIEGHQTSLEFHHLKPLAQLTMLHHLDIEHPSPVSLSVADVTSIVTTLPLLRYLRLNSEPMHLETPPLGPDVLAVIARSCRYLEYLGLFIDATLPTNPVPHNLAFQRLASLALGPSVISKESCHPITLCLSALLPDTCRLSNTAWWANAALRHSHPSAQVAAERFKLWEEVDSLLQLLAKASARFRAQQSMISDE